MPLKPFGDRHSNRLLHYHDAMEGSLRNNNHPRSKCRYRDEHDAFLLFHYHDAEKHRHDLNRNNIGSSRHTRILERNEEPFHFHPNPFMHCIPPPAYQSNPPSPIRHIRNTATPGQEIGNITPPSYQDTSVTDNTIGHPKSLCNSENMVTADHFRKMHGCKTTTTIALIILAVALFAIFLTLLIFLA